MDNKFFYNSAGKKNAGIAKFLLIFVFLFLFTGLTNLLKNQIKNYFFALSFPVEKAFLRAGSESSGFIASLLNAGKTENENQRLKIENQNLLIKISALQEAERRLTAAGQMLESDPEKELAAVLTGVSGFDSERDVIFLDKGYENGISEGMPVISSQKALFGKILKVYKNYSEVLLISSRSSVVNVKVQAGQDDGGPVYGVIRGGGRFGIYLDLVPAEAKVGRGDVLITSALEGSFPKNLLVGKVVEAEKNDLKPFQTIKIAPYFSVRALDNLFVVTDYKK